MTKKILVPYLSLLLVAVVLYAYTTQVIASNYHTNTAYWVCNPETTFVVSDRDAKKIKTTIQIYLNFEGKIYKRCDAKGCSVCNFTIRQSGTFTTLNMPACSAMIRIAANKKFMDIATILLRSHQNYGACSPISKSAYMRHVQ